VDGRPCGAGILYVRRDVQDRLWPTIATSGWDTEPDARRFETLGQQADPLVFALGEAVDFQARVGKDRIQRRIQSLATRLKEELAEIPGGAPPYQHGSLPQRRPHGVFVRTPIPMTS
jgi:selenocysteine lyase/cysteine desulfurase